MNPIFRNATKLPISSSFPAEGFEVGIWTGKPLSAHLQPADKIRVSEILRSTARPTHPNRVIRVRVLGTILESGYCLASAREVSVRAVASVSVKNKSALTLPRSDRTSREAKSSGESGKSWNVVEWSGVEVRYDLHNRMSCWMFVGLADYAPSQGVGWSAVRVRTGRCVSAFLSIWCLDFENVSVNRLTGLKLVDVSVKTGNRKQE